MLEKLPESLGRALQGQRSGIEQILLRHLMSARDVPYFKVNSSAFENMGAIPVQYTADGEGLSPPIAWQGVPEATARVVLIVEDADSPTPHPLVHAIVVAGGGDGSIGSGELPSGNGEGARAIVGLNSYLQHRWLPPDPPPGHGVHRYVFQLFALRDEMKFSESLGRRELAEAVLASAIGAGCLIGTYERIKTQDVRAGVMSAGDEAPASATPA
jgi:phosphatidylethanolamine-binding protein (PEBP) family uncharacterized protein